MGANKLETVDCVVAITKYFFDKETDNYPLLRTSLWKRLSKTGSGDNIIRMFQNKETGTVVKVLSTETKIYKIIEVPTGFHGIKGYLKAVVDKGDVEFWDLSYEIFGSDNVVNWPKVLEDPEDPRSEKEDLDMENFEWISITNDELVIACGGDWQEPKTLTIKLINGQMTVTNTVDGYGDGLSEEQFMKIINQE